MSDVSLSQGVRANLLQLQRNQALRLEVAERLATGRRVNRVNDDPQDYYTAQALSNRVGDLMERSGAINQALSAAAAARDGLGGVESLTRQLQGIAQAARGGTAEQRQAAAEQFDALRGQMSSLARDASYNGIELVADPADDLTVRTGDISGATVTVEGQAASAAALGIGSAVGDYNGFATDADIEAAIADLGRAVDSVRSADAQVGADIASLETRDRFNRNLSNTLQGSVDGLTGADLNEEAATFLALQLQDRFATAGLRFAVRTESLVVNLLGTGSR